MTRKNLKPLLGSIILILLFINLYTISTFASTASPPDLNSEGVVLMNANTGQIVYSKNPNTKYYPASTTKVLTALVVLENTKLTDIVTVGAKPPYVDGTKIGLKEGEQFTVRELLTGLILESGNDCAEVLAEHISSSNEAFAELMNKRAKELGATNSNFKNPSGLPDEDHYTTPTDLALIMKEAIKNKDFNEISMQQTLTMSPSTIDGAERILNNHNYILSKNSRYYYEYSECSKKGYTNIAKFTNVISATKNGTTYVASFLKGDGINQVYSDVDKIFDYGFNNFESKKIYSEGDIAGYLKIDSDKEIPLLVGEDVYYTVPIGNTDIINSKIDFTDPSISKDNAISRGETITTAAISIGGTPYYTVNLVSGKDYNPPPSIIEKSSDAFKDNTYIIALGFSILILLFARILYVKRRRANKRKLKNISKYYKR